MQVRHGFKKPIGFHDVTVAMAIFLRSMHPVTFSLCDLVPLNALKPQTRMTDRGKTSESFAGR